MKTSTWRGWLVAAAIFGLGLAVGSAGTVWFGVRAIRRAFQAPSSAVGLADRNAARIGADLTKSLELAPDVSARVQSILDESAANMKRIRVEAFAQAARELRATTNRIAAELPADKRDELDRIVARRYQRLGYRPMFQSPAAPTPPASEK